MQRPARPSLLALATTCALAAPLVTPSQAQACGGTFCDNSAVPMPVDQRGEDILFVQDGPEIEVHIRIEYTGAAEQFTWLIPIQGIPEVSVGSENLFTHLATYTVPRWTRSLTYECPDENVPGNGGGGFVPDSDIPAASVPDIALETTVGAFDVVVLEGGTAAEVINFLDQNGYAQDPEAEPILQEYLDEGFLFAAVKLSADASIGSIHPLVFRFPGDEPCVPIRLTRIAAEPDMGIRAYFLGQERWAPLNYDHVVLNPLAYSWTSSSSLRHTELLSLAVDAAGGRAFATDYAGPPPGLSGSGIYWSGWDETVFVGLDMAEAIDMIRSQELNRHPLIQPILLEFMPPPDGVSAQSFWNNIEFYADLVDLENWDSAGFAAALSERIIEPGLHAADLLEAWPYLTRLHTTMSPHEMTVDPMFHPAPMLGDVSNLASVEGVNLCGETAGERYWVALGEHSVPVCIPEDSNVWPSALQNYPALRIEKIPPMGPPQVIEDFTGAILAEHATWYDTQSCGDGDESGDGGPSDGETGDPSASDAGSKLGCACRSDAGDSEGGLGWLGLLGFGVVVGLRRRRPHSVDERA